MRKFYFRQFITALIGLELILTPISVHADPAKNISNLMGATSSILSQTMGGGGGMSAQMSTDMQALTLQQTPQPDKYFDAQKLMSIPGLAQYLATKNINPQVLNCATLPTTLHEANIESCRIGVVDDKGVNSYMQIQEMFTYHNQYFQIEKLYENYQASSNLSGQGFGIGCMRNAMEVLQGFLNSRINRFDQIMAELELIQNNFREMSRSDLNALEEIVAVLDGGDSTVANKARTRRPDLFDFDKRIRTPACNSMYAGDKINQVGRSKGLNQIQQDIKSKLEQPVGGPSGTFSGESYADSHGRVTKDLNNLVDSVAKQFELNYSSISKNPQAYGQFLSDLPNQVSSTIGANQALKADMLADTRAKFNENFQKLDEQRSTIASELGAAGVNGQRALAILGNINSNNFEKEVTTIENELKNKCLQRNLSKFDKSLKENIYDPGRSSHANKYAADFNKDKISPILNNPQTSLEEKLSELRALESQRLLLKMENSYEVQSVDAQGNLQSKVIKASTPRTVTAFLSDLIGNCQAQFKANKLDNKLTGASAIKDLKNLHQSFKKVQKEQVADIKNELRKRLIECSSPEEANNLTPGSCHPGKFDVTSPGFCANAALSCSKNMQDCFKHTEKAVKKIKKEKEQRVTNYKGHMEKNKRELIALFDIEARKLTIEGAELTKLFGAGFTSPTGIQREVPEDQRYLGEFKNATGNSPDGQLLLEDPEKYLAMVKKNFGELKKSVENQQKEILNMNISSGQGSGLLAAHMKQTENNYKKVADKAKKISGDCLKQHDSAVAKASEQRQKQNEEYQKKMSELGQHQKEACRRWSLASGKNPSAACNGNMEEMFSAIGDAANELAEFCAQVQNESDDAEARATEVCSKKPNDQNCQKLAACKITVDTNTKQTTECSQGTKKGHINTILKEAGEYITLSADSAPAFCVAGDNSGREVSKPGAAFFGGLDQGFQGSGGLRN